MKGKVEITKHGYEQTALAAWRQVTGCEMATLVKGTKLSDRTLKSATAAGRNVSAGTAAAIALFTGLSSTTVYDGVKLKAWSFDFDRSADIDAKVNDAAVWNATVEVGATVDLTEDDGTLTRSHTKSIAWMLGDTAVVKVDGKGKGKKGGYMLSRITAVVEPEATDAEVTA